MLLLSYGTSIGFDAKALGGKAAQTNGMDMTISIKSSKDVEFSYLFIPLFRQPFPP